jgi:Ca2+-binding RTX toxin-like protein
MPGPLPFGSETIVNTSPDASYSTVIALKNGRFMMFWKDDGAVKGQQFRADGSKVGTEFTVSPESEDWVRDINAVELKGGKIAVTWSGLDDTASDADNGSIQGRVIDVKGVPVGDTFTANSVIEGRQEYANITATGNGGFFITWTDNTIVDNRAAYNIAGQFFNANGVKQGGEITVNTSTGGAQRFSEATLLKNGNVVVVWTDEGRNAGDTTSTTVRAQIYKPDGTKLGAEFIVPTELAGREYWPDVVALSNGKFVVVWNDNGGQVPGQVAGGTVTDSDISGAVGQVFNADGTRFGDDFLMNTRTAGAQNNPMVAALKGGGFVSVWIDWASSDADSDGHTIRGQVFNADGSKQGDEFIAETTVTGQHSNARIVGLADGRFAVTWDGNGNANLQIFDPRTAAVNLKGTTRADDFVGTSFADVMRGGKANDFLKGAGGKDQLFGDAGNDLISGGLGKDKLTGGKGADDFVFLSAAEASGDRIADFTSEADDLDFSAFMDGGKFIGAKGFGGSGGAELRYVKSSGVLSVDLDGDGQADFSLTLLNKTGLTAADFIL